MQSPRWLPLGAVAGLSLIPWLGLPAQALPEFNGGRSKNVQGLRQGANGQIQAVGKGGLVRWQSFNLKPGELFQINGSRNQVLLNFVRGDGGASLIGGTVQSGPRFVLVNPSGIQVEGSGRILAPSTWLVPYRIDPATLWRF